MSTFDKAEMLYQTLSNYEGVTNTLFQRGLLLNQVGKMPEAHTQFQKALDMARATGNHYQQILTLLQLSECERSPVRGGITVAQPLRAAHTHLYNRQPYRGGIDAVPVGTLEIYSWRLHP